MIYSDITKLIGNTPLIRLGGIEKLYKCEAHIYAKLERFNPAGSAKDRVAVSMIAAAEAAAAESTEAPVEEEGDFDIRVKSFPLKPMTPEEAILQMNLLGHAFYAFEDADSGETCVVYKRNAGSYGLIIPEKKAE